MFIDIEIFIKDAVIDQSISQSVDKVHQILRMGIADIVDIVVLFRALQHDPFDSFDNIVDIGEVSFALAEIEDPDLLILYQLVGKGEVSHIRPSCWTIDSKESQTGRFDAVKMAIGISHKFIGLLGCRIKRNRIVHLVISRERNFLVATVDRRA